MGLMIRLRFQQTVFFSFFFLSLSLPVVEAGERCQFDRQTNGVAAEKGS